MIKVFAVGFKQVSGVKYMTSKSRLGVFHWRNGMMYDTTPNISDAKHYSTRGYARSSCLGFIRRIGELNNKYTKRFKEATGKGSWELKQHKERLDSIIAISKLLGTPHIFEYEVESKDETNLKAIAEKRLTWATRYDGSIYKSAEYEIKTETHGRHICKNCGLKLKNIPQVNMRCIYGGVLCVRCAISIGDEAKLAWEKIPQEEREALENEIFVHNLR